MSMTDTTLIVFALLGAALLLGLVILAVFNPSRTTSPAAPGSRWPKGFEAVAGLRLPVWIGGISLALSGFYLVKYSIDQGILTVHMQLMLGFLMGLGLIGAAGVVRVRGGADSTRISQALAGAGISSLYATVYAASSVYHTLTPAAGFVGQAAVTVAAILLSLRYGLGVVLLGLLAGYIMPAFVPVPEPQAMNLFLYLLLLHGGLYTVARLRGWWAMAVLALLAGISWVVMWSVGPFFTPEDCVALGTFVVGAFIIVALAVRAGFRRPEWSDTASYISWLTAAPLMTYITVKSGYAIQDWGIFAALGFLSCIVARMRPRQYVHAPWVSLILSATALTVWAHQSPELELFTNALLMLAGAFIAGAATLFCMQPTKNRLGLLAGAAFLFYGLGYSLIGAKAGLLVPIAAKHVWSLSALALAVLFGALAIPAGSSLRRRFTGHCTAVAAAFLAIAIGIEANADYLPVAISAGVLFASFLSVNGKVGYMRHVAGALFALFVGHDVFLMLKAHAFGVPFFQPALLGPRPFVAYGIPAVLLAGSAWILQRERDGMLPELMEICVSFLAACTIYFGLCRVGGSCYTDFLQSVYVTVLFYLAGLALTWFGRRHARDMYVRSGAAIFLMALFRTVVLDMAMRNPSFTGEPVGSTIIVNGLLLAFGLPILFLWLARRPSVRMPMPVELTSMLSLVMAFTFASLDVRQYFHGALLSQGATTQTEVYAYSAIWLILGAILLALGTRFQDKMLRVASLLIIIFTIGKVFLYDARALDGLFRVFSFMGLGFSLITLSWFYSRFIFEKKELPKETDGTAPG